MVFNELRQAKRELEEVKELITLFDQLGEVKG